MSIDALVKTRCGAFAGLTALVGAKVFPALLPSAPHYPQVAYHLLGENRLRAMPNEVSEIQARVRFSALSTDFNEASSVAAQVQACWDDIGPTSVGGVTVAKSFAGDLFDLAVDASATQTVYGKGVDVEINYRP